MPKLRNDEISIAFDMGGCPNRCRHCWIGHLKNKKIDIDRIKDIVNELRHYKLTEDDKPYFNKVFVST